MLHGAPQLNIRPPIFLSPFKQVETKVLEMIEDARKVPLPVTCDTVENVGLAAKKKLLAAASTSAADKKKLETFNVSTKWIKNFTRRNDIISVVLHGEAGSVDDAAIAKGLAKIRDFCMEYELVNIFNTDETGIFFRLMSNRSHL